MLVHLCPAVPTAPNTAPIKDISKSACSVMMMALLPPNSKIVLPKRLATSLFNSLPMRVEPVAETNGILVS